MTRRHRRWRPREVSLSPETPHNRLRRWRMRLCRDTRRRNGLWHGRKTGRIARCRSSTAGKVQHGGTCSTLWTTNRRSGCWTGRTVVVRMVLCEERGRVADVSVYRTAIESTVETIARRARYFRNLIVVVVSLGALAALAAVLTRLPAVWGWLLL